MKRIIFLAMYLAVFLTVITACQNSDNNDTPRLTIIHSNDTHSQIEAGVSTIDTGRIEGGVVERAAILETLREQDSTLLYIDAGDMVQGSPYFNIFKGELEIAAMNILGLDVATIGNHEFDNGLDALANMYSKAKFSVVSCNYDCKGTVLEPYVKESVILMRNGIKIGITGVTCDPNGMIFQKYFEGIKYTPASIAANRMADKLKAQGCDLVILISHEGYDRADSAGDRLIASESKNIDLIIGGHSHTNLENGVVVNNANGRPVAITQTGARANPMGRIDIEMMKDTIAGSCAKWMVQSITCKHLHPADLNLEGKGQTMAEMIAPYQTQMHEEMNQKLGYAPETMEGSRPQSLLGNFTADALVKAGSVFSNHPIDMAIMNIGGLRNIIHKGDVNLGDLFRIYPFENTMSIITLKGKYLEELIHSVAGRGMEAVSGCEIILQTNANHKTDATKILVGGKPIDPERVYWISTIDYLAEGNGGMMALTKCESCNTTNYLLRDIMIEYTKGLNAKGMTISSKIDNRVVVKK